jgi:DNA-directed RNA polymerase specialized sigma24 family protein
MTEEVYQLLYAPRKIDRKIGRINAKIESLRYSLSVSGIRYDKDNVQSSPSDRMSEVFAEIDELERDRDALIHNRMEYISSIEHNVDTLDDDEERTILYMQYIGNDNAQKIADTIPCSLRTYYRTRKKALDHLNEKMAQMAQSVDA